jgi:hypothetical protein
MIGNGFVVDECALRKVGGRHDHAAGTFAVGRAALVVRGHGRLEFRDGFDGDRRAGNEAEQVGQPGLHLRDVAAEIIDDLLRGRRDVLGVGLERIAECRPVRKALLARDTPASRPRSDRFRAGRAGESHPGVSCVTVVRLRMSFR